MNEKTKKIMKYVNLFGNGLSVGAALLIIIPEGISVLTASFLDPVAASGSIAADNQSEGVDAEFMSKSIEGFDAEDVQFHIGMTIAGGFVLMMLVDTVFKHGEKKEEEEGTIRESNLSDGYAKLEENIEQHISQKLMKKIENGDEKTLSENIENIVFKIGGT